MKAAVNGLMFQLMHYLNDKTDKWLKQAKNTIKENGIECITFNKNENIKIEYTNAQPKFSKEDEEKLNELKATLTNLNEGKVVKRVVVKNYNDIVLEIGNKAYENALETIAQQTESKSLAKAASSTKAKANKTASKK